MHTFDDDFHNDLEGESDISQVEVESRAASVPPIERRGRILLSLGKIQLIVVILIIAGIGAYLFWPRPEPTPNEIAKLDNPTVAPTKAASLDKSAWVFEVQNGTSTPGAAKSLADQVTTAGFVVTGIGNSDHKGYTATKLMVKESLKSSLEDFITQYGTQFKIATSEASLTDSSGSASARLIYGE